MTIKRTLLMAAVCAGLALLAAPIAYHSGAPPTAGPHLLKASSDTLAATSTAFLASFVPATEYRLAIPAAVRSLTIQTESSVRTVTFGAGDPPAALSIVWGSGGSSAPRVNVDGVSF